MAWHKWERFTVNVEFVELFKRTRGEVPVCFFCGQELKLGDRARWVFTNNMKDPCIAGNPFIHVEDCIAPEVGQVGGDGSLLEERMRRRAAQATEALGRFRWFLKPIVDRAVQKEMNEQVRYERCTRGQTPGT